MIVLDTNVLSALMRPGLNESVISWLDAQPGPSIWTTAISILEVRYGIYLLPAGRRRKELDAGLNELLARVLEGKVLSFDLAAAEASARINADRAARGRNIGTRDTQIAGIVKVRNATLATRNVKDFDELDIPLIDPWAT